MRDYFLELRIRLTLALLRRSELVRAWANRQLVWLVKSRSPEAVKRMEAERGLM